MTTRAARLARLGFWRRTGLAAMAAAVAALGQAPFDLWQLSFPGFALLLMLCATAETPRRALFTAWLAGAAYFAVCLHWIVEPFFVDAARHAWMAPFALALMAGGMALFWALASWLAARLCPPGVARVWALAGLITLAEATRATVFTGFPWAHPGHVLIASELLALSAIAGPHGLTALLMTTAALAAGVVLRRHIAFGLLPILPVIGLGYVPVAPAAPAPPETAPVVRLIQPNAPQHLKWLPEMIPVFFERGLSLTASPPDPGLGAPDLILWPETSLPVLLGRSDAARADLSAAAGEAHILIGAQRFSGFRPRNAVALLDERGGVTEVYDKHHLVPFGEYLPFGEQLARIGLRGLAEALPGGYQPGPGPRVVDLANGLGRTFVMICYEAIFPGYIRDVERPDWMAHLTNDAWFGSFSGPYQHLALARLRAAEQGLPVLRAANTGISAVIDARGRVSAALPLNAAGHLDASLPVPLPPTFYAGTGDWPILIVVFLVTAVLCGSARRGRPLRPAA